MSNVKKLDKPFLRKFRDRLNAELAKLGDEFGVNVVIGNGNFCDTNATMKVEVSLLSDNGAAMTRELAALEKFYPELVDKAVTINGKKGVLVGYNIRGRRFPFVAKVGKKLWNITEEAARR